jgi:hypothetical protein
MEPGITPRDPLTLPAALAANARGEVTARQRAAMRWALLRSGLWGLLGLAASLACGGALVSYMPARLPEAGTSLALLALAALATLLSLRALWGAARAWRALARSEIAPAVTGDVLWRGERCTARVNGARLQAPWPLRLLPGRYRFYCLEGTHWLLSAEVQELCGLAEALAQANGLSSESYVHNREGRMTNVQRVALVRAIPVLGVLGLAAIGLWLALAASLLRWGTSLPDWSMGALVALVLALALWWFVYTGLTSLVSSVRLCDDIWKDDVATYTGPVTRTTAQMGKTPTYYYVAGDLRLEVSHLGFLALTPDLTYRVYYTPRGHMLLGIEPVRPGVRVSHRA